MKPFKFLTLTTTIITYFLNANSQSPVITPEELLHMPLEELIKIEITSVSKRSESIFETPLSSNVITAEEIIRSGVTTIPEAIRLIPGVIVREQTNGVYDVHIRGFDYLNVGTYSNTVNTITLVMIDGRPVFRDFQGGTYWESLPVEIMDIERIEVVRGPSSSMYGPNAVAGIINIITKRPKDQKGYAQADIQQGNFNTKLFGLNAGFNHGKFSLGMSSNFHNRNRFENHYFNFADSQYVPVNDLTGSPSFISSIGTRYPNPNLALNKYGINSFATYNLNENIDFDLSAGIQKSEIQKIYAENFVTPWTTEISESQYACLNSHIYGANIQISHLKGYQNTLGVRGWEFEFITTDFLTEYEFNLLNNTLSIRPGINYRITNYDDSLSRRSMGNGLINNREAKLENVSGMIRLDYTPIEKLRIIASLRYDDYNYPKDSYFSYQLGTTYKLDKNHMLRIVGSRANKGSNVLDTYINYQLSTPFWGVSYSGNKNLKLATANTYEIGYRGNLFYKVNIDLDLFYQNIQNLSSFQRDSIVGTQQYYSVHNLDLKADQIGMSLNLNYFVNEHLQIRPFIFTQRTQIKNTLNNPTRDTTYTHHWTPSVVFGFYGNYNFNKSLNLNLGLYGITEQKFEYRGNYQNSETLRSKLLMTTKLSYNLSENTSIFFNIRNIDLLKDLANNKLEKVDRRQFGFTDNIYTLTLFGLNAKF